VKHDDDPFLKTEQFFDCLDRWMRNAQCVCLALALIAIGFLVYVLLMG